LKLLSWYIPWDHIKFLLSWKSLRQVIYAFSGRVSMLCVCKIVRISKWSINTTCAIHVIMMFRFHTEDTIKVKFFSMLVFYSYVSQWFAVIYMHGYTAVPGTSTDYKLIFINILTLLLKVQLCRCCWFSSQLNKYYTNMHRTFIPSRWWVWHAHWVFGMHIYFQYDQINGQ